VLLIYAAYLMLRQALPPDEALRARVSAAYLLLALAPMIWLVAVFPRTVGQANNSMHPVRPPLHAEHWRLIFLNFGGLLVVGAWLRSLQTNLADRLLGRWESGQ